MANSQEQSQAKAAPTATKKATKPNLAKQPLKNGVLMQFFEWYLPADAKHWQRAKAAANDLQAAGFSAIWLPPAFKCAGGINDTGYGVYDLYDLGEFDQKGTIPTKYGTRAEYLEAIKALQAKGLAVYGDMVFNHKMGADAVEAVEAIETAFDNRLEDVSEPHKIKAWTLFNFPNRKGKYSKFVWHHQHFSGVDYDAKAKESGIFTFAESGGWDSDVDQENANFDYLMGADLNFGNEEVREELKRFGQWFLEQTQIDGFRLDAVKHISFDFFPEWLATLRQNNQKELFAVGEYWSGDLNDLENYLASTDYCLSLFDVPLHMHFHEAATSNGNYDMGQILNDTLVKSHPELAVTFVDNHDSQAGQALASPVPDWFKPLAYSILLLRPTGYPCVFYADYYGNDERQTPSHRVFIDQLLQLRQKQLTGTLTDYFDHHDVVGWTLSGTKEQAGSGLAVLMTNGAAGSKRMYVGEHFKNQEFKLYTGEGTEVVKIAEDGYGDFQVAAGKVAIWVPATTA